jgi:DNA-binding protein YbaB
VTPPADDPTDDASSDLPDLPDLPGGLGDLLGGGGMPDLGSLVDGLAAVQSVQGASYEGTAGGGLVKITANGRMDVERVEISPDALGDGNDVELLADLVHAALNDLTAQIAAAQQQAMGPLGGILGS